MEQTVANFKWVLGILFFLYTAVFFTGATKVWADEGDSERIVRVTNYKELKKEIDNPEVDTIYLFTYKYMDLTIKAKENAKSKRLIIYAPHANITNEAVFDMIDIFSVCDYVENVSGNDIGLFNPADYHSFTVAENKTLKCLSLVSDYAFDDTYNKFVLRKGAKTEEFELFYSGASDGQWLKSDFDKSKREATIKYTDNFGEDRSYIFQIDKDGRITRMVSEKAFKFDYIIKYDGNGNLIETNGYDDYEGTFKVVNTYKDNLPQKSVLTGDARINEESYSFDENGRTLTIKKNSVTKDGESVVFYSYNYDQNGRLISQYVDYGKDSYKMADYYTFNSKSLLTKGIRTYYNADGQQDGDSEITTYKYDKSGILTKKTFICGGHKETTKVYYDEDGFYSHEKVTVKESGRVDVPMTLEEFKQFNHLLFVENQQEKMFERHTSQSVAYYNDFPLAEGMAYNYYVTPDSVYSEGADWMEYGKDRLFYQMFGLSDPKNSVMLYVVDLMPDWKSELWRYMPTDESTWMDFERDQFVEAYKEDGKIHLFTRYNEELSQEYAEGMIGVPYEGETYLTESVFDEKNYDYLEMIVTKELNGTSEVVCRIVFDYDVPEPAACAALRCAFETTTENMVNATFVVDPGTKNEISKSFMVPVNTNIAFNVDDFENTEIYTDSKCENPVTEGWDKMSDVTRYIKHVSINN